MAENGKKAANGSRITKNDQSNKFICFDDLKAELRKAGYQISQVKDLQNLLNSRKSGKDSFQACWERVIPTKDAKKIFHEITGKELNLSKIKYFPNYFRDIPLSRVSEEEYFDETLSSNIEDLELSGLIQKVQDWYLRVLEENPIQEVSKSPLLGIVCSGGFLRGESKNEDDPFVLPIESGINIFVGDRGSGKSTVLDMLSLLLDSSRQRSQEDNVSEWIAPKRRIFHSYGNGRVTRILKDYGITKYVCFFYSKEYTEVLYAFYANLESKKWCLLHHDNDSWSLSWKDPAEIFPEMLILRQGDVFRITESRNKLVINQLLEGLNPDLKDGRSRLFESFDSLARKYKLIEKNSQEARDDQYTEKGWLQFRVDNQLIDDFLRNQRKDIEHLKMLSQEGENSLSVLSHLPDILSNLEFYLEKYEQIKWVLPENSFLKLIKAGEAGLWCLYVGLISEFLKQEIKAFKDERYTEEFQVSLSQHLSRIFSVLEDRLSIISKLQKSLEFFYEWNSDLKEICNQSAAFFHSQSQLIKNQIAYSQKIEKYLSFLEEQKIEFSTILIDNQNLAESLKKNETRYQFLFRENLQNLNKSSLNQNLYHCFEVIQAYNSSISDLKNALNKLNSIDDYELIRSDFIDFPIDVKLKQGKAYRSFDKLSYGQKSGVILTIVLRMTQAEIVLIDQPEDNLDSYATAKILTPTLLKVCEQRILAIATHNSSLVMGLGSSQPHLIVMESPSEYGGKRHSGKLNDPEIVNYMFEILEGGLPAWEEKLKFFKSFTEDLVLVEDSNLSSTIASLRNIIQPRMSHNERLRSLRHDLISKFPTLEEKQASVEKLNSIIDALDKHDREIIETINNIKNLTMGSYPENIDLYSVVKKMMDNRPKIANIEYNLDINLKGVLIYANPEDVQIIFRNLFDNSVKAIREVREERERVGLSNNYSGKISIKIIKNQANSLMIEMEDNGIGIHPNIIDLLYRERCSIRGGRVVEDHGHGGIIIKSYLRANGANIRIDSEKTRYRGINSRTVQILTFKKREINL